MKRIVPTGYPQYSMRSGTLRSGILSPSAASSLQFVAKQIQELFIDIPVLPPITTC